MKKEIRGLVKRDPVVLTDCCLFAVEDKGGMYLVVSTERQADKDYVFVKGGQEIRILGSVMEDERFKGILLTQEAQIKLKTEWTNS